MESVMTDEEWRTRCDLATCYHLFAKYGWTDLIFTHISARVPGHPDQYLINPYGLLFTEITPHNLLKVGSNGELIDGDHRYNEAGHAIHSAILNARHNVNAVLHSHSRAGIAVSCMEAGLLPLSQQSAEVMELVCYHDYGFATNNAEECQKLVEDIGDKWLMLMRNHGLLSTGRSVAEAFYYHYMLENACKIQVDVLSSTSNYVRASHESLAQVAEDAAMPDCGPADFVRLSWAALQRLLYEQGMEWAQYARSS